MARKSLSELSFAALLTYSPRGSSEVSQRSRVVRNKLKSGEAKSLSLAATRLCEWREQESLDEFFGPDVALVPTPGSAPLVSGGLWVPDRICRVLVSHGLASAVFPCLQRARAVPKSAFAESGDRPTVDVHRASLLVTDALPPKLRLTLVDDFVTKGRTLFAAASVLANHFPSAEIRAFALVRTMGLIPDIEQILDPCVGKIRWVEDSNDVDREP